MRKTIWVCTACHKTSPHQDGGPGASWGWDVSCMLNSIEVYEDSIEREGRWITRCEEVKAEPVE